MALRAFYEQTNRHGQLDRIELYDAQYGGASPELQFKGDKTGFTRQWDEITSESNEKLINIQANRIQIGKYDFRPRIENATGFQILEDIRDSDNKRFHIVHKIDGTFEWAGWVTTRIFSYPEKDNNFFAHIRATDFEILKGQDYTLDDTRQTFITTFADLLSDLPTNVPIKTATSWVEQNLDDDTNVTKPYDFLGQIYHETKALRDFARTGDETDQPITKWEALEHVAEPGLLIRQMGGHVMIDQLTDLADPTAVNETIYDATGTVTTATRSVDRRQTGYTTTDNGTPVIKVSSQNDTYPAIKRVRNKFNHRTKINNIKFPRDIVLQGSSQPFSQLFISDGDQKIIINGSIEAQMPSGSHGSSIDAGIRIRAGTSGGTEYWWDGSTWSATIATVDIPMYLATGNAYFRDGVNIETDNVPSGADGTLEITFLEAGTATATADRTEYNMAIDVQNPVGAEDSTSINYQLTQQSFDSPTILTLDDTYFGDGPVAYAVSALRHGTGLAETTGDTWRRRGQTISYRNYHENLLKEVIDLGRTNVRKLEADIWGAYDPSKVLDYNGSYFFFAGGKYDGTTGRWRVTLMELDLQTDATDNFEDILKFTDETGSGEASTTDGGGGGLTEDTANAIYFRQDNNLSEGDPATIRANIGTEIGVDVQAWDAQLDTLSGLTSGQASSIVGVTSSEYDQIANIDGTTISSTQWGYLGVLDQNLRTTDAVTFATVNTGQGDNELYAMDQDVRTTDAVTFNGVTTNGVLDVNADVALDNANTDISTDTFMEGFAGIGLSFLNQGSNKWKGEMNNLTIRERLKVYELLINQLRATNGDLIVSSASKPEAVSQQGGTLDWTSTDPFWTQTDQYWYRTYKITIEENKFVPFQVDDLVRAQRFTGEDTHVVKGRVLEVENGSATVTDNSTTRYFVINILEDSDVPQAGMDFIRFGNVSDPDRQGLLYLSSDDANAPFLDILYGLDSHADFGGMTPIKGRIGRLDGITDSNFTDLDGTQTNLFGVYFDGNIYINDGNFRGKVTVTETPTNSNDAATKGYVDNATAASGNQIIRSDTEPTTRTDGSALVEGDIWIDTDASVSSSTDSFKTYDGTNFVDAYTVIDGANISTETVTAAKITVNDLEAFNATIGNWEIESSRMYGGKSTGSYTGLQSGSGTTKAFFAGADDKTGTNASAYITADGQIFYDALGTSILAADVVADFTRGSAVQPVDLTDESWKTFATVTGASMSDINTERKRVKKYWHRSGYNKLIFIGFHKRETTGDHAVASGCWSRVDITVNGVTASTSDRTSSAFGPTGGFMLEIDLTSSGANLTGNTFYDVEVELTVRVESNSSAAGTDTTSAEAFLREDIYMFTAT